MRLDHTSLSEGLADAWDRWARRCGELRPEQWATRTRCGRWHVRALVAHVCPDPGMFEKLAGATVDGPAAVTDGADLLRRFNDVDGIAHAMADDLAEQAIADADTLTPEVVVARFAESARRLRTAPEPGDTVISHPIVGSTTLGVITEVALMEATVHLLDLADAVGGVEPSPVALAATRDLLVAVPDPTAVVEVLAGRTAPATTVPAIR